MAQIRDWKQMTEMSARLLMERTGEGVEAWNQRIKHKGFDNVHSLRAWLAELGVTGYAQSLLVMEQFGYPDFFVATGDELIDSQYADRSHLRPIYDAIVTAASGLGEVIVQARKTYVSLRSQRRTFARVRATTKSRVDLALRLDGYEPGGRLQPSKIHETTQLQIGLTSPTGLDSEVLDWLKQAYEQNS